MTIIDYYTGALKKYATFSGRARRAEYWYFVLLNFIINIALTIINPVVVGDINTLGLLYGLAVIIPAIAVAVRRLHDVGKSGWWMFISLIPIVGWIWLIVLYATKGNVGDNQYGPDPKKITTN